tara:strand:- start:247 stop:489 length:243 start_codon:yes stop_codon:yes gene_type:complete
VQAVQAVQAVHVHGVFCACAVHMHPQADDSAFDVGHGIQLQRCGKALVAGQPDCEAACAGTELEHGVRRLHTNSRTAGRT